jgi:hypothetical protein
VVVLNSQKPLWSRPKDEITAEEHAAFYRHLAHGADDPLETVHFKGEGASEYTALLYIPSERPIELFDPRAERSHVACTCATCWSWPTARSCCQRGCVSCAAWSTARTCRSTSAARSCSRTARSGRSARGS